MGVPRRQGGRLSRWSGCRIAAVRSAAVDCADGCWRQLPRHCGAVARRPEIRPVRRLLDRNAPGAVVRPSKACEKRGRPPRHCGAVAGWPEIRGAAFSVHRSVPASRSASRGVRGSDRLCSAVRAQCTAQPPVIWQRAAQSTEVRSMGGMRSAGSPQRR